MKQDTTARFWSKVKIAGPDECWEWIAYKHPNGYGQFYPNGKPVYAHRFSFLLATGETPEVCMHLCDNPSCVNPSHLRAGTQKENMRDAVNKKRHWESAKTECLNGHLLSGDNLYVSPKNKRVCKICRRIADRKRK